ncbi:MAG: glycosyltransferase family 4 protein [Flavobacteriales bacterium]|nr:glycosyltransferase family 4 protein [Flavobacteriales bacterium]
MALVVNGRYLDRPVTGVERYAGALACILAEKADCRIERPQGATTGHAWEQLVLPLRLNKGDVLLSLANTGPLSVRKQVLAIHDLAFLEHPEWFNASFARWYRWLLPRLARRVAQVITPSEQVRASVMRSFGVKADRIGVVPPFLLPMHGGNNDPGIGAPYCLLVGSMDPRKRTNDAIAWYATLKDPAFQFVWVGRPGRAFIHKPVPQVKGLIHLTDADDARLAALYQGAIALIQPSCYEGFGLTLLEAMHHGCPVIATDLPVFRESFGDAVLYADVLAPNDLDQALAQLASQSFRYARIALGRAVADSFTRERTRTALRNVLDPLLLTA